ncbi:selenide, water dikinase SelD [candidate division KSB1 bacterium]|nr:selenide, water dikinase SelD [candidate division KSB1 bacterium]RQW06740.1 MAG: selenide, water dikinase SelD [candidate division KSB1 bacterium]
MDRIYLDYNATTPVHHNVKNAMLPYLDEKFGNPSSSHWYGVQTKMAIEKARAQVAFCIGCENDEIYFTSGGSESNNLAIKGYAFANQTKGRHIITSAVEHPAVHEVCRFLQQHGFIITYLPVDEYGRVDVENLIKSLRADTILISIMHANNEVGTIQPIEEISAVAKEHRIALHTDAAQSIGKIAVRVNDLGVDMLSIAGHKLYAPKGVGALYVRHGTNLEKQIHGADHERNMRAGTENVLEIVGLGQACEVVSRDLDEIQPRLLKLGDRFWHGLQKNLDHIRLNGHPSQRLPNTLSISFYGLEANTILSELDSVAASAGAACHSDQIDVSYVLEAMHLPSEWAMGTIRFSIGAPTTKDEIDTAVARVTATVQRIRGDREIDMINDQNDIKLTHFTHGLGCACKLRPQSLETVLKALPKSHNVNVLVDTESSDDAAVYKIDENLALVQTVDFFTPIVDDPYHFGAIAAANSLSDIYAMGAEPMFALNIVGFPANRLPISVLHAILRGALDKAQEAGIPIIGGHTVDDTEPKFGLAVAGKVSPQKIWRNAGALPGDILILTKPLGLGIISTALKRGMASPETEAEAIRIMSALNREAAEAAAGFPIHACTDVTGFGLLGHLSEMTRASSVDATLYDDCIPIIQNVVELANAGAVPGGTMDNLDYTSEIVYFDHIVSPVHKIILADAQTSGGLLFAVAAQHARPLLSTLESKCSTRCALIGEITQKGSGLITVSTSTAKSFLLTL